MPCNGVMQKSELHLQDYVEVVVIPGEVLRLLQHTFAYMEGNMLYESEAL